MSRLTIPAREAAPAALKPLLDAAEVALDQKGHWQDAKADAVVSFATKVARLRGKVSDTDIAAVRAEAA